MREGPTLEHQQPPMKTEERNVPFKFSKHFRYSYEGINLKCYKPGEVADVSPSCARSATINGAGHAVHISESAKPAPGGAAESKQATNPVPENKSGIGLANQPKGWKR